MVTWLYPGVAVYLVQRHRVAVVFCFRPPADNDHGVLDHGCSVEETGHGLQGREMFGLMSDQCAAGGGSSTDQRTPPSYLVSLGGDQQRPGEVWVVQTVELARGLHGLHVKAVASEDVYGVSLLVVHGRVAI